MRRVLLTGGTGFVGRQILKHLSLAGCPLRLIARDGAVVEGDDIRRVKNLFTASDDLLAEACEGIHTVVHSAWYTEPGKYLESPLNLECLVGTLRLAQVAAKSGVRRFVGVGTCFEYDVGVGYLKTTTPLVPRNLYGSTKASAFQTLSRFFELQDVSFAWCRLFYLYGEGEDARRLVPFLHARLSAGEPAELTSGKQIRDFLDVAEAGRRIAEVALSDMTGPLNICSGEPLTVADLARRIADQYGRRDLLHFGARTENPADPLCVIGERSYV